MRTVLIGDVAVPACDDCDKPRFHPGECDYKRVIPSPQAQEQANRRSDDPQVPPNRRRALSAASSGKRWCRCCKRHVEVAGLCRPCYCRQWRKSQSPDSAYGRRARDRERWARDRQRRLSA